MVYEVKIEGIGETVAAFGAAADYAAQGQFELADEYGARTAAAVRGRAVGRPGPRRITGVYLGTITYRVESSPGGAMAVVYSDAPQAQRLELGFYGFDSLGRYYEQPAYQHFRPAYDEQGPHYIRAQHMFAAQVAAVANRGTPAGGGGRGGFLGRIFGRFRR